MEKSLIEKYLDRCYSPAEAGLLNPLTLAYIGDEVFSRYVRKFLVAQDISGVNRLTALSAQYVKAHAQAEMAKALEPILTEDEKDIIRRGRNAHSTPPKNADKMDYKYATGIEALMGYLELTGNIQRQKELMIIGLSVIEVQQEKTHRKFYK